MAKKSKTQRARASASRAARKEQIREEEPVAVEAGKAAADAAEAEAPKRKFFKKSSDKVADAPAKQPKAEKKIEKKPEKKRRFGFLKDVRSELKRVTWPTKQDVLQWSVVVILALLFFGVFVAVLDNFIVTPVLVGISGLGA